MSGALLATGPAAVAHCTAMLAVLGADTDRFRLLWANADEATRRMLLTLAKQPYWLASRCWDELAPATRGQIKRRAAALQDWLNRTLPPVAS